MQKRRSPQSVWFLGLLPQRVVVQTSNYLYGGPTIPDQLRVESLPEHDSCHGHAQRMSGRSFGRDMTQCRHLLDKLGLARVPSRLGGRLASHL